jgi:alkaline ceramidase TOD1/glycosyltransferase MUCI70-like protein
MTGGNPRLDPRTVPRSRLLDRLGPLRPHVSIVVLIDGNVTAKIEALRAATGQNAQGSQLVLARCAGVDPAACPAARLSQTGGETLVEFANRAGALGIGRLLVLLPPGAGGCGEVPALLERFIADPWLGVLGLEGFGDGASGLITRESLWTALGGFESSYRGWDWAVRDFCLRARAIGYAAPAWPTARATPGDNDSPDARLFADRAALAPDRSARSLATSARRTRRFTIYTAITNRYDTLKPQPAVALEGCDQVAFLDRDTSAAFAGGSRGWHIVTADPPQGDASQGDPHRAARFHKINAHLALPASEYSLWIDASIGVACPFPLPRLVDLFLGDSDLCVFPHYARRSVYEEAEACVAYGLDRRDIIEAQIDRYRAEGLPATSGLIEASVLLRRHSRAMRALNEAWWAEIVRGSRRDQLSFNYVAWKLGLSYALFPLSLAMRNGLFVKFMRSSGGETP